MNSAFKVSGMHCEACQKVIEKKLMKIEGVTEVNVEPNGEVAVTADHPVELGEVQIALDGTDYQVS